MDEEKKDKVGVFSFLWPKVVDLDSSQEAASLGGLVAGYLAFSYALNVLSLYLSGESLFAPLTGSVPADTFEYYFQIIFYHLITVFFGFSAYRVYKQKKFGLVPFLSLWLFFEIGYKFYLTPGRGIIISILFTFCAVNALRGWFGIRKYQET